MSARESKTALVTGITGQDGSYLSELLLEEKGYRQVLGLVRRRAVPDLENCRSILDHPSFTIVHGDLEDPALLTRLLSSHHIDECYNLAAQSFVRYSFDNPVSTDTTNYIGVIHLLEAIRHHSPATRFYQASTSEMYGGLTDAALTEASQFHPRSPYGTAKLAAYWHVVNMREAHGLFGSNGILFNHESPRRGDEFVTQKVVRAAARYRKWRGEGKQGTAPIVALGNLEARRDWGHAKDYVEGIWRILQHPEPDDFVLCTGETQSVRRLVELSFANPRIGVGVRWQGEGREEIGLDDDGNTIIEIDPRFYRPSEVHTLKGDPSKAEKLLGWKPRLSFEDLIDDMVGAALEKG